MTHIPDSHSCSEYSALSRRQFLGKSSAAVAATASSPVWLPRVALGKGGGGGSGRDTFVSIFLRGGQDGLTAVPPYSGSSTLSPMAGLASRHSSNAYGLMATTRPLTAICLSVSCTEGGL